MKNLGRMIAVSIIGVLSVITVSNAANTFQVTATVNASCTVNTPFSTMAFGLLTPPTTDANVESKLIVDCNTATYFIGLDYGLNSSGGTQRKMLLSGGGATTTLNYNIYKETGHTNIWGPTGTDRVPGIGAGLQTYTAYGQIFAADINGTATLAGDYSDIINWAIEFS